MKEMNHFEFAILKRVSLKYPFIEDIIPLLEVESRLLTGVGMYINFVFPDKHKKSLKLKIDDISLSTNELIEIEGLKNGLFYEVVITDGWIDFIELVTCDESWDGKTPQNFKFVE